MSKKILEKVNEVIEETLSEKNYDNQEFLQAVTFILESQDPKKYARGIKKAIKFLEKRFDEEYLLLYRIDNGRKVFHNEDNKDFLNYGQDLANILNHHDYMKEADKLNVLYGKIELGFKRYFMQRKEVLKFCPSETIFEFKENIEVDFSEIINNISTLKDKKKKKSQLKKYEKYFESFPEKIYTKETKYLIETEKSLFPLEDLDTKEFQKENTIIQNLNSVKTAIAISKLLK